MAEEAKKKVRNYGYVKSPDDPRDVIFGADSATPETYILKDVPGIFDQGADPICAAVTLSTMMGWQRKARGIGKELDFFGIYDLRDDKDMEGMVPRQALSALKHIGVDGYKIKAYARVTSVAAAKSAIQVNGPILLATMAYGSDGEFWVPIRGVEGGGHATTLVGWTKKGFILQNSWGYSFGAAGQVDFPFEHWNKYVMESWTIML